MKKLLLIISIAISISANAQDVKTVTLVVSGQGKTQDEAKQVALRSAIEQAFGTFISSKTEILNDNLIKDEIVSVSNGNIQKFDVLSEVQIPDGGYATTLKAIVSISKLTSFCESKGLEVEFKGAVFALNIKQQKLNEESELKVIEEMAAILKNIADHSFDFEVAADGEPTLNGYSAAENWKIPLIIRVKLNKNFENYKSYFQKTLSALTMTEAEANNYINLKKPIYSVMLRNQTKVVDTLFVMSKVKPAVVLKIIKNYLLDSMNYLEIGGTSASNHSNLYFSKKIVSELEGKTYVGNLEEKTIEKYVKIFVSPYFFLDTTRLMVISGAPLYNMYYLRNEKSSIEIQKLVFYFVHAMQNFILDDGTKKSYFTDIYNNLEKTYSFLHENYWYDNFNTSIRDKMGVEYWRENSRRYGVYYGRQKLEEMRPYTEKDFTRDHLQLNSFEISNARPLYDLNQNYQRDFIATHGVLFNPIFPGLKTTQYNCNKIIQNSNYNIVLQFNQLCIKDNLVAEMKFADVKSLDELNKINGYKIYPKK